MLTLGYRHRVVVVALFFYAVIHPLIYAADESPGEASASPLGRIRVLNPDVPVDIDNAYLSFNVGDSLPLFQENDEYFIALVDTPYEGKRLSAFPLKKGTGKTAWVTPENTMFFGYRTLSTEGKLYLHIYEELPVIGETPDHYEVVVERLGRQAAIQIPKVSEDFMFLANTKVVPHKSKKKPPHTLVKHKPQKRRILPPATSSVHRAGEEKKRPATNTIASSVTNEPVVSVEVPRPKESVDEALMSFLDADSDPNGDPLSEDSEGYNESGVSSGKDALAYVINLLKQGTLIVIVTVGLILLFIFIFIMGLRRSVLRKANRTKLKSLSLMDQLPELPPPEQLNLGDRDGDDDASADFSGSIASMSLGAVTQFLNSDKESGTLSITADDKAPIGTILFNEGEIVDARCDTKRGVDAVYELLRNQEGLFAFSREDLGDFEQTVKQGTISLLLDAHRIMDEEGEGSADAKKKPKKKTRKTKLKVRKRA